MLTTLALDTSTARGGIAVLRDGQTLCTRLWTREKSHSEIMTSSLEACMQEAGIDFKDLSLLAVGVGPGSFTGIRVAVNAARTIAFSLAKPVMAFHTPEILVQCVRRTDLPVLVMVNAHKNLLYTARFVWQTGNGWRQESEVEALDLEQIGKIITIPHICVGDGYDLFASFMTDELRRLLIRDPSVADLPDPVQLGLLAERRFDPAKTLDWNGVQALYIRASEAEERLREGSSKDQK